MRPSNTTKEITLQVVATAAGVSPSTVSRIINGTAVVNARTKQKVIKVIEQLGYVPDPMARGLAGGRSMSVGVITQSIDSPFYGAALRGIEDELESSSYSTLFVSGHWASAREAQCVTILQSRRVDGIIVLTGKLSNSALLAYARTLPIVVTGREIKAPNLFSLNFDNIEGGRLATRHLLELGHSNIAFVAGMINHPDASDRLEGYRLELEEAGLIFDEELVINGNYDEQSGLTAIDKLLERKRSFTAIFAANDQMASGVILGLRRRSLRVPEDVSVVGFDNLPTSMFSIPPMSTVHHPAYEIGRLAASALICLISGKIPSISVPKPVFICRESSGLRSF